MTSWKQKLGEKPTMLLAPTWYLELKIAGHSEQKLRDSVRNFCLKTLPSEEVDEVLIDVMIASYEA